MTKRDRYMILTVVAVVLLGAFWFLLLAPQRKSATAAEAELTNAQSALSQAQAQLNSGKKAEDDFRRDRTTIVKLGRVVPETDDIPTLLTQLQALADKEKVEFQQYSISSSGGSTAAATAGTTPTTSTGKGSTAAVAPLFPPGSVQVSGGLGRTPISLQLEGTFFQLEKYLEAVQRFAVVQQKHSSTTGRLMIVDGFSYTKASDKANAKTKNALSKQPKLTATLAASVYFAPPIDTPAAPTASGAAAGTATPGASTSTSTGTAAIGGLQ